MHWLSSLRHSLDIIEWFNEAVLGVSPVFGCDVVDTWGILTLLGLLWETE